MPFSSSLTHGKRLLVIGDLILDRYHHVTCNRVDPDGETPIFDVNQTTDSLGGAANLAHNLITLGQPSVGLIGVLGRDHHATSFLELAKKAQLSTESVLFDKGRPTTRKTRILSHEGSIICRIDEESREEISSELRTQVLDAVTKEMQSADCVFCSDYNKGFWTSALFRAIFAEARKLSIPTFVDPKGSNPIKYKGATVVKPNIDCLAQLTGRVCNDDSSVHEAANILKHATGAEAIVITCGSKGAVVLAESGLHKCEHDTHQQITGSTDPNGGGDTFLAMFGLAYISGKFDLKMCASLANAAAAVAVSNIGTYPVQGSEVLRQISHLNGLSGDTCLSEGPHTSRLIRDKVVTRSELERRIIKRPGKIVFTNGCFDLLHAGHVSLLEVAKTFGSTLIVGLNTDQSVSRLKGRNRPNIPEKARAAALSAFSAVDMVVMYPDQTRCTNTLTQEDDTPLDLIRMIKPDVLIKGGDYRLEDVIGRDFVDSIGGRTIILPLTGAVSTTWITERVQNRGT